MNKNPQVSCNVKLSLRTNTGKILYEVEGHNLIVTTGKNLIAGLVAGEVIVAPSHMAIGNDNTAPVVGDTALGGELGRVLIGSISRAANVVTLNDSFPGGIGTGTVEEIGLFNDVDVGIMIARFLTGTFTKGAADILDFTWTLTFT